MNIPPGVEKARELARFAKDYGWSNGIEYKGSQKLTILTLWREGEDFNSADESFMLMWERSRLTQLPEYNLFDRTKNVPSQKEVMAIVESQPDIVTILKKCQLKDKVGTVNKYRKLPFDAVEDTEETIKAAVVNKRIWWYNRIDGRIQMAKVIQPRSKKSTVFNLKEVGHRRMLSIVDPISGMRSIMLDTILKVE